MSKFEAVVQSSKPYRYYNQVCSTRESFNYVMLGSNRNTARLFTSKTKFFEIWV